MSRGSASSTSVPSKVVRWRWVGSSTSKRRPAASKASLFAIFGRPNENSTRPSGRYRQTVRSALPSFARFPIRNQPPSFCRRSKKL